MMWNSHTSVRRRQCTRNAVSRPVVAVLIAAAITAGFARAQVPTNVLRRVVLIHAAGAGGTAFTIEVDGRQYLITAKHVVAKLPNEALRVIQIRKKEGWAPLEVTVFKCDDPVDIAVLVPKAQVTVNFQLEPTMDPMLAGQDAYFVGFPYETFTTNPNVPEVLGFVKRATVSGFVYLSNSHARQIQLDGYNNPGFSGSPVVYVEPFAKPEDRVFKVAGVLVSYVYDAAPVVKKIQEITEDQITPEDRDRDAVVRMITNGRLYRVEDTQQVVKLNSGIATAWGIGSAVELIRRHPIGPKAADDFRAE